MTGIDIEVIRDFDKALNTVGKLHPNQVTIADMELLLLNKLHSLLHGEKGLTDEVF